MKNKKAPKEVIVNGKKFLSINQAAGFMNMFGPTLKRQLDSGVTEYKGYKISYFKIEDKK